MKNERTAVRNPPPDGPWRAVLLPSGIAAAALLPFLPALRNGFVNWDDAHNFLDNSSFRGLGWTQVKWMFTSSIRMGHYMPLTWLTLGADYGLWGLNPAGYHLTNLLLHAANAVAFFFVGARLLAAALRLDRGAPELRLAAALSALLFAVHPLRVESVVWATERRDVLSGLFFLLTILGVLRLGREPATPRRLAAPLGFYALSLCAKSVGVTLPLALLVLDVYPLRRLPGDPRRWLEPESRPILREKIPFFALAAVFTVVGYVGQRQVDAAVSFSAVSPAARLAQSIMSLAFYVRKTLLPVALSPVYLRPAVFDPAGAAFMRSAVFVGGSIAAALALRRRWPALPAAYAYYAATLLPTIGLIPFGSHFAADRYSYLPCLAWPLLAAGAVLRLRGRARGAAFAAGVAILVLLGALSWRQTLVWRDSESLWRQALSVDNNNYVARINLADALSRDGDLPGAAREADIAVRLSPDNGKYRKIYGGILMALGRAREAGDQYEAALRLEPDDAVTQYDLGVALQRQGRWQEAVPRYRRALELDPRAAGARNNLGAALVAGGKWSEAIDAYREALRLDPGNADAHDGLGVALAVIGPFAEALPEIDRALALRPNDPQFLKNRAWIADSVRRRRK
ncbi:MAG: tetratricopeptide repeat protein [Elusimicrobiota bacterium]